MNTAITSENLHRYRILILDFGSQYTQLIARRIREIGVYCEIHPYDQDQQVINNFKANGIILSGGPSSVTVDGERMECPQHIFDRDVPVLGICYGMQIMAEFFGGAVVASSKREFGHAQINHLNNCQLFEGIINEQQPSLNVWMSHGDHVRHLPEGFSAVAASDSSPIAVMADESRKLYAMQFHPEVTHTDKGLEIMRNFVCTICACETLWNAENIAGELIAEIKQIIGDDHVLLGLSGGVDSSVVAALVHEAIGDQLTCVFVDHGLLRLNEGDQVMETFARNMGVKVIRVNVADRFFAGLKGVDDPEQKRKIIGALFIDVFQEQAKQLGDVKWLAQGTIYPDVIESAGARSGKAHVIKSHHNVGGLPEKMQLKLLEPLRELFKDEVRRLGEQLGIPHQMIYRHPFPGPGMAVRVLGEVKPQYVKKLQLADAIFMEELHNYDLYNKTSQAFAVYLPVSSVGVMGDQRKYDHVIALRAVETVDFMTAIWAHLPYDFLGHVSNRIINEVAGISRVVYDISGKPPATIEWE